MKILLLNTFDEWGGAAKAASRLARGLKGTGLDASLLVQGKSGTDPEVLTARHPLGKLEYGGRAFLDTLPVRLYPEKPIYNFTPALVPDRVAPIVAGMNPDLIHLHWTAAGFLRIETLRGLRRPLVWTLHDSWAFTGGCHIPHQCLKYRQRCGACPVLGSSSDKDLSRWTWLRKIRAWQGLNLTVVAPSRWLADCARASSILREVPVRVIPNGVDLTLFKPVGREMARQRLGLQQDKKYILFGAVNSTSDPNKGFNLLLPALRQLAAAGWGDAAELLVFGAARCEPEPDFGMKARYLGRIGDESFLALLYSAADLLVVPSLMENLPNTTMEAMACGTPCVAFDQGGMRDLVDHESTGFIARAYDPDHLAYGIRWVLADPGRRENLSVRGRRKVEELFSLEAMAHAYAELYAEVLQRPV